MSGNTARPVIMLAAGVLLAGLSSVLAAEPPTTLAEAAQIEKAQTDPSTTRAKACPAWWLTAPPKPAKTGKGKTRSTPEYKRKSSMHKPPPKSR
jgi:hypothetical protein